MHQSTVHTVYACCDIIFQDLWPVLYACKTCFLTSRLQNPQANHPIWQKTKAFGEAVSKLHEAEYLARLREIKSKWPHETKEKLVTEQQAGKQTETREQKERVARLKQKTQEWQSKLVSLLWEFDRGEIYMPSQEEEEEEKNKRKRAAGFSIEACDEEEEEEHEEQEAVIERSMILSTYNICGDKALHICMLVAYSHPDDSPARLALLEVAQELICTYETENPVEYDAGIIVSRFVLEYFLCVRACVIYTYIYIYIYIYIYTYIHTYIHTYRLGVIGVNLHMTVYLLYIYIYTHMDS
jgi:hypothetical protein